MRAFRCLTLIAALAALDGCTRSAQEPLVVVQPPPPPPPEHPANPDDVIRFAVDLAQRPASERTAECRTLQKLSGTDPSLGIRLHLIAARTVAENCGDPRKTVAMIEAALPEAADERVGNLLRYQRLILARLIQVNDARQALEKRIARISTQEKKAYRRLQSQEGELKSQESELKTLQKKLDALKAIEQSLEQPTEEGKR